MLRYGGEGFTKMGNPGCKKSWTGFGDGGRHSMDATPEEPSRGTAGARHKADFAAAWNPWKRFCGRGL